MIPGKPAAQRLILFILSFVVFSTIKVSAQDGAAIFKSKCASCHVLGKDMTGPNLQGVVERWGGDVEKLHEWIKNNAKLTASGYPRAVEVSKFSSTQMTMFEGSITDPEIDAILKYVNDWKPIDKGGTTPLPGDPKSDNSNAIIFGVISLILAVVALILMQVNSNLKKLSDDAEGINRPEPVPFYRNKVYIAIIALFFFVVAGYFISKGAIGLQRQKNYQPEQPIFYSHKVHAGINQINCLYCHGNAWESKSAAIPSVNVCMNCHKTIQSYEKGPKLYAEDGHEVNGTQEIAKLYDYAGFDPKNADKWDPTKAKQIEWTRIHNLPDHVFFSHAQHIRAGKVQCQTCHGEITAMDEVKQFAELSMGWCVNCHRQTKVDFNYDSTGGNKFYSIYEKFHNDIKAGKMDSVTVKDIGGLECQKCHY
ncbi:MAG: c-type cytochrome [Chitinophagaceae bacterium]